MNTRRSYDYARPTTLVLIISDALDSLSPHAQPLSVTFQDVSAIVTDAFSALSANVGMEDAIEMVLAAGIDYDDIQRFAQ